LHIGDILARTKTIMIYQHWFTVETLMDQHRSCIVVQSGYLWFFAGPLKFFYFWFGIGPLEFFLFSLNRPNLWVEMDMKWFCKVLHIGDILARIKTIMICQHCITLETQMYQHQASIVNQPGHLRFGYGPLTVQPPVVLYLNHYDLPVLYHNWITILSAMGRHNFFNSAINGF